MRLTLEETFCILKKTKCHTENVCIKKKNVQKPMILNVNGLRKRHMLAPFVHCPPSATSLNVIIRKTGCSKTRQSAVLHI